MGELHCRLWDRMIKATEDYLSGDIGLRRLVESLEGSLRASEIRDDVLIKEFYGYWEPLEVQYACHRELGSDLETDRLRQDVEAMRVFLIGARKRIEL